MANEISQVEFAALLHQISNIAETIANLNYLMCVESKDPSTVRAYSEIVAERLQNLHDVLRSASKEFEALSPSVPS